MSESTDRRDGERPDLDAGEGEHGEPSPQVLARGRERRFHVWYVAFTVAMFVVGVLVIAGGAIVDMDATGWALVVGMPLGVMLLVLVVTLAVVRWRRRRGSSLFARSPLWELPTQRQRRRLMRALRRGDHIDPSLHDLARRAADDMVRRRGVIWLYVFLAALQGANVALQDGWIRWLFAAITLLFLGLAVWFAWLIRRMRRARERLDATAAPTPPDGPTRGDTAVATERPTAQAPDS